MRGAGKVCWVVDPRRQCWLDRRVAKRQALCLCAVWSVMGMTLADFALDKPTAASNEVPFDAEKVDYETHRVVLMGNIHMFFCTRLQKL